MSVVLIENSPLTYDFAPVMEFDFGKVLRKMDDDEFFEFCRRNSYWRIEMGKHGEIIIMPPTGTETGRKIFKLAVEFGNWVKKDGKGEGFDSSTGFRLPNGARRSPDLSWIKLENWEKISKAKRKKIAPICPDFVIELRSESDSLKKMQAKMSECIKNGTSLGWLIDATKKRVYVYRPNVKVEILNNPTQISGEPLLQGFTLNLKEICE